MGETNEDLAEHGEAEGGRRGACATIADPVAEEDEEGRSDDCEAGAASVESPECCGRGDYECEEETGAEPVDYAGVCGEEIGCCVGDGGVREPLRRT